MLHHGMELFGDVLDAFFHYSVVVLEDVNRPVETGTWLFVFLAIMIGLPSLAYLWW
jgi:hypothetical protein